MIKSQMKFILLIWVFHYPLAALAQTPKPSSDTKEIALAKAKHACAQNNEGNFNNCIAATIKYISADRGGRGYMDKAFTRILDYGPNRSAIPAHKPPYTMCVAAVSEVIIEALNFYYSETKNVTPFDIIPASSWNRMRATDIRSYMWENAGRGKRGAGNAFSTFGLGTTIKFGSARPGDFISYDRSRFRPKSGWTAREKACKRCFTRKKLIKHNGKWGAWQTSGHSVIFLGFLNRGLKPSLEYASKRTIGFLYFSSQGTKKNGGFGYRWAIFKGSGAIKHCGKKKLSARTDCALGGINRSSLRVGRLWHPKKWDRNKRILLIKKHKAALRKRVVKMSRQENDAVFDSLTDLDSANNLKQLDSIVESLFQSEKLDFNSDYFDGITD